VRQVKLEQNVIEIGKDIAVDLKKVRDEINEVKKWHEDANKIRTVVDYKLSLLHSERPGIATCGQDWVVCLKFSQIQLF